VWAAWPGASKPDGSRFIGAAALIHPVVFRQAASIRAVDRGPLGMGLERVAVSRTRPSMKLSSDDPRFLEQFSARDQLRGG